MMAFNGKEGLIEEMGFDSCKYNNGEVLSVACFVFARFLLTLSIASSRLWISVDQIKVSFVTGAFCTFPCSVSSFFMLFSSVIFVLIIIYLWKNILSFKLYIPPIPTILISSVSYRI